MVVSEKVKQSCYAIATLGCLGEWIIGGVIASTLSIPFMFLYKSIYWLNTTLFTWFLAASILALFLIIHFAFGLRPQPGETDRFPIKNIVLNKIVGGMVVLIGVPLKWRIVIFGFVLFHVLDWIKPFPWYRKIFSRIESMPGVFGVVGAEVFSGILVNAFLQLIIWITMG
jgi:phosphatidylglycerophosphatase A